MSRTDPTKLKSTLHGACAGEYTSSNLDASELATRARQIFYESIRTVYPAVFEDLREQVFPIFWKIATDAEQGQDARLNPRSIECRRMSVAVSGGIGDPSLSELHSAFSVWAKKYNMAEEKWFIDGLLRTLFSWAKHPRHRRELLPAQTSSRAWAGLTSDEARFSFDDPGWAPTVVKWRDFEDRVLADFRRALTSYKARVNSLLKSRGYDPVHRKGALECFDWLVLWQIAGHNQQQIASWHANQTARFLGETRIRQGIEEAAELVGLTHLRQGPRGPKRKPKSRS